MSLLDTIQSPVQVKQLSLEQLEVLASEIRERIIAVTARNGGHIGPNLGVVELTIALHRVFDTPDDRFVFDVSHQGYVHKLLTGRNDDRFDRIRLGGGLSGFLNRYESEHDCYGAGHAGTALSAALGMAVARDRAGGKEHVVAVCGDAAFTCGITMEALNNIATSTKRLIVILNDNEWSIAKNVGAIANYLNELITNPLYTRLNDDIESFLQKVPGGNSILRFGSKAKKETKDFFVSSSLFEKFGLKYVGPIDGHDTEKLTQYLEFAKSSDKPVLLHVLTKKGRGCEPAINHPEKFHGTSPFNAATGESVKPSKPTAPNYQDVFGQAMVRFCEKNEHVVGITAAMPSGTGLNHLAQERPHQFYDVGIAEEHAVLFAAGLATRDVHPVCAIYSTFLQRAYDPIIHDVCLQDLPVLFCMDRAGLSPNDGATHHGLFDIAYLRPVPRAVIMQPKDEDELVDMMATGLHLKGPAFIRYPRGAAAGVPLKDEPALIPIGKAEVLREGAGIVFWALGPMVPRALKLAEAYANRGISAGVVNARFAKPLDEELLHAHAQSAELIVTLEDHAVTGGFGSAVLESISDAGFTTPVVRIGWPDVFVDHGSTVDELQEANGLSDASIKEKIDAAWQQAGALGSSFPEAVKNSSQPSNVSPAKAAVTS
jgi:1-deoxy-D-xylulose-5-phosphate synthase